MASGIVKRVSVVQKLRITAVNNFTITSGSIFGTPDVSINYDYQFVNFCCRITLKDVAVNIRPTITITNDNFLNIPTFIARGGPVMRGSGPSTFKATDECYGQHDFGGRTIVIAQNNFSSEAPAGYASFQINGSSTAL